MKTSRLWIYKLLAALMPETRLFALKAFLLRWCGAIVGKNVRIDSMAVICGNGHLVIGDNVWIGPQSFIYSAGSSEIRICDNVDIGPGVMICNGTHNVGCKGDRMAGEGKTESIVIGEGTWLCARAVVCAGVRLKPMTIVAAGAVVVGGNCNSRTLLAGIPARERKIYS